jgi:hypothetical protein
MISHNGTIYFTAEELRCKGSGMLRLAPGFDQHLLELRLAFARPMGLISCCRSEAHNKAEKGAPQSFHICDDSRVGTCAIDVATPDPGYRTDLLELALSKGWSVGVKKTMLHLDMRTHYYGHRKVVFVY